jgi:hypothetical protein
MIYFFKPQSGAIVWETDGPIRWLEENDNKKCFADLGRETGVRSLKQNAALHKYYELLADELNAGGFSLKYMLGEKEVDLDWDGTKVKELIWRPIQKALTGKASTTKLDKVSEINNVYEHLNRFFSNEPFCIHVPFPSKQTKP